MKDRKKGLAGEIFLNDLTVDMSGKPYILFILALALGCGENEPRNCVVSEVIRRYGDDIQGKDVFVHDGTKYTERRSYAYDPDTKTYADEPGETATFTWYEDGRISKAKYGGPGDYQQYEYTYDDSNPDFTLIEEHFIESAQGNIFTDRVNKSHYVESPKDGNYRFDNVLEVYENGNLVKLGFADPTGSFEAYDTTWNIQVSYRYDNFPNALGNFAFRGLIYPPNWGRCRNNMIEETYSDAVVIFSKKQSFAFFGNGRLNRWENDDTKANMSFVYQCE
ncbi:MAG TPA: hypothetical protein VK508_21170 [Cyclobacteriaceae bacterium]|nr:hypothetical protein [Cyclobacteriaceae bacterium]